MDRLISEKAVLEAFREYQGSISDFYKAVKAIPSAEPCEDAISRQAVIDITWEEPSYTDALNVLTEVRDKVKALPPVKPQEPKIVPIANIHFDEDKMREVCKEVAENIVVEYDFKGKTNGEVIKMLFPNIDNYFSNVIDLRLWWNSPYDPQERSEKE